MAHEVISQQQHAEITPPVNLIIDDDAVPSMQTMPSLHSNPQHPPISLYTQTTHAILAQEEKCDMLLC